MQPNPIEKTALGRTGLSVTKLCFGLGPIGDMPDTYGYQVEAERARDTVRAVFDSPVNFLDTSRNYGFGRSEERIGEVIRERGGIPEGFVISSKLDRDMETNKIRWRAGPPLAGRKPKALNVDRIQLLHVHDPEYASSLSDVTGPEGRARRTLPHEGGRPCRGCGAGRRAR